MAPRLAARELERRVLEILWDASEPLTPGEVHQRLPATRPLAYTTVMTILVRLWHKDLVARTRQGKAFAYSPTQSRADRAAALMHDILKASGSPVDALARFVDAFDSSERDRLRLLLESGADPTADS